MSNIISLDYHRRLRRNRPKLSTDDKISQAVREYGHLSGMKGAVCGWCGGEQRKSTKSFICNFCLHKNEH